MPSVVSDFGQRSRCRKEASLIVTCDLRRCAMVRREARKGVEKFPRARILDDESDRKTRNFTGEDVTPRFQEAGSVAGLRGGGLNPKMSRHVDVNELETAMLAKAGIVDLAQGGGAWLAGAEVAEDTVPEKLVVVVQKSRYVIGLVDH